MPKLKTNRATKKRVKRSASGKLIRNKVGRRHILSGKPHKRKRQMRKKATIAKTMEHRINSLVPYL